MIYVFLAEGFEEIEALAPVDILRRGGIDVKTVAICGNTVTGAHGIKIIADINIDDAVTEGLEGIVLPGGMPGTLNLENDEKVISFLKFCAENRLLIGCICAAPSILGHNGMLKGRRATCFPGFENELEGAILIDSAAVKDGNIITGKGAGAATQFALALLCYLKNEETAEKLSRSMCCV